MKALIFPFQRGESLAPLRSLCPDFLLPMAGKPIVEHLVEQLVTAGIRDVTLLCDDRSEEVAHHFGNGERWGCRLAISSVRDQGGLQRMLRAALHGIRGGWSASPATWLFRLSFPAFWPNRLLSKMVRHCAAVRVVPFLPPLPPRCAAWRRTTILKPLKS